MPIDDQFILTRKAAEQALAVFKQLRGSTGDFNKSEEAAALIYNLTVAFVPASE